MPRPKGSKVVNGKLVMPSKSEAKRIYEQEIDNILENDPDLAEEKYNAIRAIVEGDYIKHNNLIIIGG